PEAGKTPRQSAVSVARSWTSTSPTSTDSIRQLGWPQDALLPVTPKYAEGVLPSKPGVSPRYRRTSGQRARFTRTLNEFRLSLFTAISGFGSETRFGVSSRLCPWHLHRWKTADPSPAHPRRS